MYNIIASKYLKTTRKITKYLIYADIYVSVICESFSN